MANIAGSVPGTTFVAVDDDDDDDESKDNDPAALCAIGCPPTISPYSLLEKTFEHLRLEWVSQHKFFMTMQGNSN